MKKILFILLLLFIFPVKALAANVILGKDKTISSDYISYGDSVVVEGRVEGDAFLAGGLVTVNGQIDGDLFVTGGKIQINGPVGNSIRIFGGDVSLTGSVGRNVLLIGGNLTVSPTATIGGSLLAAGGNMELSAGKIGKGFRYFGSRLYLNTIIPNEAYVVADRELLLGPHASVSGDLKYTGQNEAILSPGAIISGKIIYQPQIKGENYPQFFNVKKYTDGLQKLKPVTEILGLLVSFLVGFVLLGLFPKYFEKTVKALEVRPYASFGWGILAFLLTVLVSVLLVVTIVGIPVAGLTLLILITLSYLAKFVVAFFLGRKILLTKFGERRGWAVVLGLIVLSVLNLIPFIGGFLNLILILLGLGGLVLSYRQPVIYEQPPLPFKKTKGRPKRGRR